MFALHFGIDGCHGLPYAASAWLAPGALKSIEGQFL
jgi:hypothetical protein